MDDEKPVLKAVIKVEPKDEGEIKGLDVTCGKTTWIPIEVDDDDER